MMESDSSSTTESTTSPKVVQQCSRRFSPLQTATLNAYYKAGMKSTAESCMAMITRCSSETNLDIVKVKVSVNVFYLGLFYDLAFLKRGSFPLANVFQLYI